MSFFHELKRRNVFKVGVAYALVAWVTMQLADLLIGLLELPGWVGRLVILLVIIGFPIALVFAWAFELTPDGLKLDSAEPNSESKPGTRYKTIDFVIIFALLISISYLIADRVLSDRLAEPGTDGEIAAIEAANDDTGSRMVAEDRRRTIAVLPFSDISPDGNQAWLADGIAEDLLDLLSRIEELRVIARTSSFAMRDTAIAAIGERLNVGSIVEGSVRRSGERIRVTAQLIWVSDSTRAWSASFDRELNDVFAIQREIAAAVADAIRVELGVNAGESWQSGSPATPENVQAWEYVKVAGRVGSTSTEEGWREQIDLCRRAVEIEPDYAAAHACVGSGATKLWQSGIDSSETNLLRAETSARRALELDPEQREFRQSLAELNIATSNFDAAIQTLKQSKDAASQSSLSLAHHLNGDDEAASRVWIDSAPSTDLAADWQSDFRQDGFSGVVESVLAYETSRSGKPCTEDAKSAVYMLAVLGDRDRLFSCIDEMRSLGRSTYELRANPIFDPYRDDPRFGDAVQRTITPE